MKRFAYLFSLTTTALILAFALMTGCEGPAGPAGADGTDGTNGIDGIDGTDGTAVCAVCHNNNTEILGKSIEAAASGHITGGHYRYGDRTTCSPCHTHEGFLAVMGTASYEAPEVYEDATPPNCRTCHMVHTNYDLTDFDLRTTDPVTLWFNGVTVDLGNSNICVACHQVRMGDMDPVPVVGGADLVIDDDGWASPHQAMSPIVYGTGGYEVTGSVNYPAAGSTAHAAAGCIGCHMVEPGRGNTAGGHTTLMSYESRGNPRDFTNSCETSGCHGSVDDFDYVNIQTDVADLLDSLETILTTAGVMVDGDLNASSGAPLTMTANQAGAYWNLLLVSAEKSGGVHNPNYTRALLKNSIQSLSSK